MNIVEHVSLLPVGACSGYISRNGIAGSSSSTMSNFLRNCQTDFQSGCKSLQSHQQWGNVPLPLHLTSICCHQSFPWRSLARTDARVSEKGIKCRQQGEVSAMPFMSLSNPKLFCTELSRAAQKRRFHLTLVRIAKIKNSGDSKCWQGCEEIGTFLHCWWDCKLVQALWKSVRWFLRLDIILQGRSNNTSPGHIPRRSSYWQ